MDILWEYVFNMVEINNQLPVEVFSGHVFLWNRNGDVC